MEEETKKTWWDKVKAFLQGAKEYFLVNILDLQDRLDTGRIGQIIGMISLTAMSTWATWQLLVYQEYKGGLPADRLKLFSIAAAFPLALAALKDFAKTTGSAIKPKVRLKDKGFCGFIKRNTLDEYGRLNIERLGQMFGMVNLSVIVIYIQAALYLDFKIDMELATTLSADSGFPMLLYRIRDWIGKRNAEGPAEKPTKKKSDPGIEDGSVTEDE